MGLEVGGTTDCPDWPKLGPSMLIATCLIVAIRTAKWAPDADPHLAGRELGREIEYAAHVAHRVLSRLLRTDVTLFPQRKEPWYKPDGEDQPK
ncbi:MAG TPA: hypothetical protein VHE33_17170 [Acidobacteriaceae bacterium]|nr:hypothetical protein [Acidobacteriaceae bacterium]